MTDKVFDIVIIDKKREIKEGTFEPIFEYDLDVKFRISGENAQDLVNGYDQLKNALYSVFGQEFFKELKEAEGYYE